jgi:hypothetical protein
MTVALLAPGFLFLLTATALLIIVSVSTPVWKSIYFLEIGVSNSVASSITDILPGSLGNGIADKVRAGVWGYCIGDTCTARHLGYTLPDSVFDSTKSAHVLGKATTALVLHPIAAGLAAFALTFALCGNIVTGLMASAGSFLAFVVTLVAFVVDLGIFVTAKHDVDKLDIASSSYGNALWMTLAAVFLLLLASVTVCCAHHRSRRARNTSATPAMSQRRRFWRPIP